jgi:tetratricopeptide (TPR) repeat protein
MVCLFLLSPFLFCLQEKAVTSSAPGHEPGAEVSACATCHAAIVASYAQTAMAKASGPAIDGLITGEFEQRKAGIIYRVYETYGNVWLSFASRRDPEVRGKRVLKYYIGSGHRGRTYLFATDGFWFEAPVNWYGQKKTWDMAPAYQEAQEAPLNLPLAASCLACHTTGMAAPAAGTENRYASPPFAHAGVTCERCHGDGVSHAQGSRNIVNPAKLTAERRDAVCMQCHVEGNAAIEQPGKHLYDFRPGDDLSDYVRYFVKTSAPGETLRAASQFEALAQSACKRKAGDRMSCMSCHDPHMTPTPEERVVYYREKCLACHGEKFASHHHAKEPDCVGCHMPPVASSDVAHTQATDHRILSDPRAGPSVWMLPVAPVNGLVEFPSRPKDPPPLRDLALAWVALQKKGIPGASREVDDLLPKALKQSPDDVDLLSAYGYEQHQKGATTQAREVYEHALRVDRDAVDVQTNLAVIEASSGERVVAIALLQKAFQKRPWQDSIGMNLAVTLCQGDRYAEARDVILRVLQFDPDSSGAKAMLRRLNADRPNGCR